MKKDLGYYMRLNYPVQVAEIPDGEGGGYVVSIPLLGNDTFLGDGETLDEAFANLQQVKRSLFASALKQGVVIPEPTEEGADLMSCSGQFVLRIPRALHRDLKRQAAFHNTSLNQYCEYLLTRRGLYDELMREFHEVASNVQRVGHDVSYMARKMSEDVYRVHDIVQTQPRFRAVSKMDLLGRDPLAAA